MAGLGATPPPASSVLIDAAEAARWIGQMNQFVSEMILANPALNLYYEELCSPDREEMKRQVHRVHDYLGLRRGRLRQKRSAPAVNIGINAFRTARSWSAVRISVLASHSAADANARLDVRWKRRL